MQDKRYLNDIVIIRLVLIVALVAYHSFAPYTGGWTEISEDGNVWYELTGRILFSAMLPAFVFISGIIAGYQVVKKGKPKPNFIIKKFKRLIIPSVVFGVIFYLTIGNHTFSDIKRSVLDFSYLILNGYAHLWFLPMLFWCFVSLYVIITFFDKEEYIKFIVIVSLILNIFSFIGVPFQISKALYYFNFFYIGFLFGRKKLEIRENRKWLLMILGWAVFFSIFWFSRNYIDEKIIQYEDHRIYKACILSMVNTIKLLYMWFGTLALYFGANFLIRYNYINVSKRMRVIGSYCFGVYIFQEPILRYLYYKSNYVYISVLPPPITAFLITLFLSLVMTYLMLKTRVGRYLLG